MKRTFKLNCFMQCIDFFYFLFLAKITTSLLLFLHWLPPFSRTLVNHSSWMMLMIVTTPIKHLLVPIGFLYIFFVCLRSVAFPNNNWWQRAIAFFFFHRDFFFFFRVVLFRSEKCLPIYVISTSFLSFSATKSQF